MNTRCAKCGWYFTPKDKQCYTLLAKADPTITLCEDCSEVEQDQIEQRGTKELSELLNTYNMR
jgi:hypothetical protein